MSDTNITRGNVMVFSVDEISLNHSNYINTHRIARYVSSGWNKGQTVILQVCYIALIFWIGQFNFAWTYSGRVHSSMRVCHNTSYSITTTTTAHRAASQLPPQHIVQHHNYHHNTECSITTIGTWYQCCVCACSVKCQTQHFCRTKCQNGQKMPEC